MGFTCDQCGGPINQFRPGRIARYCSDKCRVAFNRPAVPEIMRKEARWATYAWPAKRPLRVDGRGLASTTDPGTWSTYPQIRAYSSKGFMLGGGIGCVDIDHCLIRNTDQLHPIIEDLVEPLLDKTYIEVSPSGTGLHVFGLMNEDRGWVHKFPPDTGMSIELYSRERFIIVTGERWSKTSQLGHIRQYFHRYAPVMG